MKSKILFIDQEEGLVEKLSSKDDVEFLNNSEIEDQLMMNKIQFKDGYSIIYTLPLTDQFDEYDIIFVNYNENKGLSLALNLKTDKNKVYVMSTNTLFLNDLIEEGKIDGYVHKNGYTSERILNLIK